MPKKRKLEAGDVDVQFVEIYEDLASPKEATRLKAASSLFIRLTAEPDLRSKVLKRLIRGLASGRKSARVGFSVALTEFLRLYASAQRSDQETKFALGEVLGILESSTTVSDDAKGHEVRDHWYGKLFGATAIVQSQILFSGEVQYWTRILDILSGIMNAKVWLREECGWLLYQTVIKLKDNPSGEAYIQCLVDRLFGRGGPNSREEIAIWIAVRRYFPNTKFPGGNDHDPLSQMNKEKLASGLMGYDSRHYGTSADDVTKPNGAWFSKVHFAWDVVLEEACEPEAGHVTFLEIWREAVDGGLFASKASPERRYWGFSLFQRYLMKVPSEIVPSLFGSEFARCLKRELTSKDQYLNAMALDVMDAILARTLEEKASIPALVFGFLDADVTIDRQSRAKPIEKLIGHADMDGLERIVRRILEEVDNLMSVENSENLTGLTALIELLVSVFRARTFPSDDAELGRYRIVVDDILATLVRYAFSGRNSSKHTEDAFKQRLISSLNLITAKDPTPTYHPSRSVAMVQQFGPRTISAERQVLDALKEGCNLLVKLQTRVASSKEGAQKDAFQAFELLLAFSLLEAYSGGADSVNTIDDLQNCYRSLAQHRVSESENEDVVAFAEIIVEFVSKPSALYRRLAPRILAPFCPRINEEALKAMYQVLLTTEDTAGQTELFAQGDEEAMNDAESESGSSEESDVEIEDINGAGPPANPIPSDESSSPDDSSASDSDRASPDADLQAFDAKLAAALGTSRPAPDAEPESSSDADMSDSAMEALDAQLRQIFRQRLQDKNQPTPKQQRRGARDTMVNFKTKILELLETYIKSEFRNPVALSMVQPLLESVRVTGNRNVAQKTCDLVRTYTRLYKLKPLGPDKFAEVSWEEAQGVLPLALELLRAAHELVHSSTSQLQAKACSSASLLAAKVYLRNHGPLEDITIKYDDTKQTLECKKENKFRVCFLEDWENWRVQAGKEGQLEGR